MTFVLNNTRLIRAARCNFPGSDGNRIDGSIEESLVRAKSIKTHKDKKSVADSAMKSNASEHEKKQKRTKRMQ